jgi:hypothetical protein
MEQGLNTAWSIGVGKRALDRKPGGTRSGPEFWTWPTYQDDQLLDECIGASTETEVREGNDVRKVLRSIAVESIHQYLSWIGFLSVFTVKSVVLKRDGAGASENPLAMSIVGDPGDSISNQTDLNH